MGCYRVVGDVMSPREVIYYIALVVAARWGYVMGYERGKKE